jgi:GNAT superfamily N-acetyltransferase
VGSEGYNVHFQGSPRPFSGVGPHGLDLFRPCTRKGWRGGLQIRRAVTDDRSFVVEATQRLASFEPPVWRTPEEIVSREAQTLQAFFEAPPVGSVLLIAEGEQGDRLGFAYLERAQDYFTQLEHGHVGMLVVTKQAGGQGVGGALMRAAEGWAREQGYDKLTLTVFERNRAARAMYEHLGYEAETLRYVKIL